jgi:hypothetical protein
MKNKRYMKNSHGVLAALCGLVALAAQCLFGAGSSYLAANTYDAAVDVLYKKVVRTNDVAVATRHLLWTEGATAGTTAALADATTAAIGTIDNIESETGIAQDVLVLGKGPMKKVVASEAITVGARVYQAASGKVAASGTILIGIADTAATTDGNVIRIRDHSPITINSGTAVAATRTILASEMDGRTFFFGHATEFAMTLPAPFLGARAKFLCTAAPASASYTIVTASSANIIKGSFASAADAGGSMDSETSGGDTITFVDGQAVAGDWVALECDGTNWFATGIAADEDALTIATAS